MKKFSNRHLTRQTLLQALYQWQLTKLTITELLDQFKHHFTSIDELYFKELLEGIFKEYKILLMDYQKYSNIDAEYQDPIVQAILLISTYELKYKKDIPYKVVLNEALELSKEYGSQDSYKFVNGILEEIAREYRIDEVQSK